jgi:hypothetical protein
MKMEKTELREQFEKEQNRIALVEHSTGKVYLPAYGEWLERKVLNLVDKAEAYDRLMDGGKKTLKEWANIFGMYFAVGKSGVGYAYKYEPLLAGNNFSGQCFSVIYPEFIDYTGDWKDSLTLPDGWEC